MFDEFAKQLTAKAFPEKVLEKLCELAGHTSEKHTLYLDVSPELNNLPWECILLGSTENADTIGTRFVVLRRYDWPVAPNLQREERLAMFLGDDFIRGDAEQVYSYLVQTWSRPHENLRKTMQEYGAVLLVAHGEEAGGETRVIKSAEDAVSTEYYIGAEDYDRTNDSAVLFPETAPIIIADVCHSANAVSGADSLQADPTATHAGLWATCIRNGTRVFVAHMTRARRVVVKDQLIGSWFHYQMLKNLFFEGQTLGEAVVNARTAVPPKHCYGHLNVHNYISAVYVAPSVKADETARQLVAKHKESLPLGSFAACAAGGIAGVLFALVCDWFWVHLNPFLWGLSGALLFTAMDSLITYFPVLRKFLSRKSKR
jgi:hypothetical protein